MKTIPHNFTPRSYQLELFKAMDNPNKPIKRALLRWHRRAGKDKACFCYLVKRAYQEPGNYFYIFPTREDARKALWMNIDPLTGMRILDHIPAELIHRISNQEMVIELKAGKYLGMDEKGEVQYESTSTIQVIGYDKNPDSVRGTAVKGVCFSEFAYTDPEVFKIMSPSIKQANGWVIINSTPNGRNHYFDLWEQVKDSELWFTSELQTYWPDLPNYSGLVSKEDIEQEARETGATAEEQEREYGVSFNTGLTGSYYIDQLDTARAEGRVATYLHDTTKLVNTWWDLGASDNVAIWFTQTVGNTINAIDYYESSGESIDTLVRVLASKNYRYDMHYLPHDAGPDRQRRESNVSLEDDFTDSLNDFHVTGLVQVVPKPSRKQAGIQATRQLLGLCCFDNIKCADGLRHLELYHKAYDKKGKTFRDEPVHDEHSHSADAFRLIAESKPYIFNFNNNLVKPYWNSDGDIWKY